MLDYPNCRANMRRINNETGPSTSTAPPGIIRPTPQMPNQYGYVNDYGTL